MTTLPLDVLFRDHGAAAGLKNVAKSATDAATATAKLDAANAKLASSERKVADAAGQVKLAEAKLAQVRSNAKATMTQRLAAEENLARSQRRLQGSQAELALSSRRVATAQKDVASAQRAAAKAAEDSRSTFQKAAGGLRTMGTVGVNASHKMVGGFKAVGVGAAGVAVGILALAAAPIKFGLEVAAANENAAISFTTMLGSARKAQAFLTKLKAFAAATPFEFPELQRAASSLISVGVSASKVIPIMKTLGDVTSGMGTGSEGVQRATIAIQQMASAGRITAEDLNQLRDAGIPLKVLFKAMGEELGVSSQKLFEMSRNGKLGKKELEALMKVLESGKGFERFNGLMDKQSKSLNGMLSTLKDTFGQGMADALQGAIPFLKGAIGTVTVTMGKFFSWAQTHQEDMVSGFIGIGDAVLGIGIAFTQMAVQALQALSQIGSVWDGLNMFQKDALKKMGIDGSGLSAIGKAAGDAANILGTQLLPKLTAAQEKWVAFGKDQASKAALRDAIMKTTTAIGGLGNAVDGSQIKLKHWSDRSKLSAVNQSELRSRIQSVKKAFHDQVGAMEANNASHKSLVRAANASRASLVKEFRAMGIGSKEARELARKIIAIPKKHETKVSTPGADSAKRKAESVGRAVGRIPRSVTVRIGWYVKPGFDRRVAQMRQQAGRGIPVGAFGGSVTPHGVIRRAFAGPIPGWSPNIRADNIPVLATAGEYMHDVPAVRYWGGGFMAAVNRKDLRTVQSMVNSRGGGGAGSVTYITVNAPNVADTEGLRRMLVNMDRRGQLAVIKR